MLIAISLLTGIWLRSPPESQSREERLALLPLPAGPDWSSAGPFQLVGAWQLSSPHPDFGGYSALLQPSPGRLLAFSDRGYFMEFSEPGMAPRPVRIGPMLEDAARLKDNRDIESATLNRATGQIWIALEGRAAFARHNPGLHREQFREVPEMRVWPQNSGSEAVVRLTNGRFVVLCECNPGWSQGGRHPALLFASDPLADTAPQPFTYAGIDGYRPTDMAQLPDGRVLILARRLVWPMPARFAIKILIADPDEIMPGKVWQAREVADLSGDWPVDNYEGLAIERQADGNLIAWLISDENAAVTQRVLLLKLRIDESKL